MLAQDLGLLVIGENAEMLRQRIAAFTVEAAQSKALAQQAEQARQEAEAKTKQAEQARQEAETKTKQAEQAQQEAEATTKQAEQAQQEAEATTKQAEQARQEAEAKATASATRTREMELSRDRILHCMNAAQHDTNDANYRREQAEAAVTHAVAQASQAQAERDAVLLSSTWQMTWPIRMVASRLSPMLRRPLRGTLKLAWWSLTLKLPRKLKERRAALSLDSLPAPCQGVHLNRRSETPSPEPQIVSTPQIAYLNDDAVADTALYGLWTERFDRLQPADRTAIQWHIASGQLPSLLVLVFFGTASQAFVDESLDGLGHQLFGSWRAILCFDRDCESRVVAHSKARTEGDGRFIVVYAPLGKPDMQAIAGLEETTHLLVMSGDTVLREIALYGFAAAASENPEACLIYSDEDRVDTEGRRSAPWFKPDFSPELLRGIPYLGNCALLQQSKFDLPNLIEQVSATLGVAVFLSRYATTMPDGAVTHVPFMLHGHVGIRTQPDNLPLTAELREVDLPSVTIIIPTRDRVDLLDSCLASIESTSYPPEKIEVMVTDRDLNEPETLRFLLSADLDGRVRLVRDGEAFNYGRLSNRAASRAVGDVLVFLDNGTEANRSDWLRLLVNYAMQPDVAAVGVKLLYADHTIQHGGMVLGISGVAGFAHGGIAESDGGYQNLANLTREVSVVTGACMAIRRSVFWELGGFNEALAIAFQDVSLCLEALQRGYRNIFIAEPLAIYRGSKNPDLADTSAKRAMFLEEATHVRTRYASLFKNDPYYSPNLSLERAFHVAWPPRTRKLWRRFACRNGAPIRVLMLSITHEVGHGVAVVLNRQSVDLASRGFEVFIGGPQGRNEFTYEGCHRVCLEGPQEAACFAFEHDIDCIVAHTPPFFSTVRWLGVWPRSIIYDYGEPNPELFPDTEARRAILTEKQHCYALADRVFAISHSVQAESGFPQAGVIRLGNTHLAVWDDEMAVRRRSVRASLGFADKLVVLNVCRFQHAERCYKGVDIYARVLDELGLVRPDLRARIVFALSGKANDEDAREMEALGLQVFSNPSDDELTGLYAAADVYMNFSQWEGYNLGIGQALALGLPVIASDIPAHREFPIFTSSDLGEIARRLSCFADELLATATEAPRRATLFGWDEPLEEFAEAILQLCSEGQ
jgi:GT2 family glycosyltransferase/glycosyltransferase involved in cell wall biosynthesis